MTVICVFLLLALSYEIDGRGGRVRFRPFISHGRSGSTERLSTAGWYLTRYRSTGIRSGGAKKNSLSSSQTKHAYSRLSQRMIGKTRKTNYGTKFEKKLHQENKKTLGLGVGAGFIGGSGIGYAATLATYSIYHRYLYFMEILFDTEYKNKSTWDEKYHDQYYRR